MRVAERLRQRAREAVRRRRPAGVHVGGASASPSARPATSEPEEILRDAAIALHRAKVDRHRRVRALRSGDARPRGRAAAGRDRPAPRHRRAARSRSHYQPIVVARDRRASPAFEALVRWRHPVRGLVSPIEFIPRRRRHRDDPADRPPRRSPSRAGRWSTWQRQLRRRRAGGRCASTSRAGSSPTPISPTQIEAIAAATGPGRVAA